MAGMLITVATGAGGLAGAVAILGLGLSVEAGGVPDPAAIGLLVVGVVAVVIGFVSNFEHQSRLWATETEAQLQGRRRDLQSLGIIPGRSPQVH
ncbi:hypothetical protein CK505_08465 [Kocuria sp. WN036]|uniref:hypothetical protein n=1 Tax=Kocuria sp. WN036 TaxID=2032628 RepID=UPI000BAB70A6|nr:MULTISPECIES: hypothetical protein [Kocuria]PAU90969.1 hypothetical protein CK505_08465 [Kocuria sp. WN036]THE19220.1 hypothetical protein E1J17_02060 [Kocuria rosea]